MHHHAVPGRFFRDKNGKLVVLQWPNVALWCFIILRGLTRLDALRSAAELLSGIVLSYWAIVEILKGGSPFRRVLGVIVIAVTILNLLCS